MTASLCGLCSLSRMLWVSLLNTLQPEWAFEMFNAVPSPLTPPAVLGVFTAHLQSWCPASPCLLWPLASLWPHCSSCSGPLTVSQANQWVSEWGLLHLFSPVPEALPTRCIMEVTVACYFITGCLWPSVYRSSLAAHSSISLYAQPLLLPETIFSLFIVHAPCLSPIESDGVSTL